jgi:hypothetical protein
MRLIAIRNDFLVNDVSDEEDIKSILEKIDIGTDVDVRLDLSGCLIDYPATSGLIDKVIKQLIPLSGPKDFEIITDYTLPMSTVINWIFLGSCQLNMLDKKELSLDGITRIISDVLKPLNIKIKVTIKDKAGLTQNEFKLPAES